MPGNRVLSTAWEKKTFVVPSQGSKEHVEACRKATGSVLPGPHTCTRRLGSDVSSFSKHPPQHVGAHTHDALRAIGATVLKLSRSQRDHELRKEKAAHTALLVSTVGKGVLASAWSKKNFQLPNKKHLDACRQATGSLLPCVQRVSADADDVPSHFVRTERITTIAFQFIGTG